MPRDATDEHLDELGIIEDSMRAVYFYDEECALIPGASLTSTEPDERGPIPQEAATAVIEFLRGATQWVYVQVDERA